MKTHTHTKNKTLKWCHLLLFNFTAQQKQLRYFLGKTSVVTN